MLDLLVTLLVLCICAGIFYWVVQLIPLPPPFKNIVLAICGLIFIVILLGVFGLGFGGPTWHVRWR